MQYSYCVRAMRGWMQYCYCVCACVRGHVLQRALVWLRTRSSFNGYPKASWLATLATVYVEIFANACCWQKSFQRIFLHSKNFWHIRAIVSARAYTHSNAWAPPTTSWKVTRVIHEINLVKFLSQYIVWTFSENFAMYGISWILMQL